MKSNLQRATAMGAGLALSLALVATVAPAQKESRMQDAERHSREAAEAFTEIMNVREKAIPKELLDKAEAIAVFPDVVKAAFIVVYTNENRWSKLRRTDRRHKDRLCFADHESGRP